MQEGKLVLEARYDAEALASTPPRKPFTSARVRTWGNFAIAPSAAHRTVSGALKGGCTRVAGWTDGRSLVCLRRMLQALAAGCVHALLLDPGLCCTLVGVPPLHPIHTPQPRPPYTPFCLARCASRPG